MSVEIEVGLENAVNVKVPQAEPPKRETPSDSLVSPKLRRGLALGAIVLVAAGLSLFL